MGTVDLSHRVDSLASFVIASLLLGLFVYVYLLKWQKYLLFWTAAWALLAGRYFCSVLLGEARIPTIVGQWFFGLAVLALFLGAQLYSHERPWMREAVAASCILGGLPGANVTHALDIVPIGLFSALLLIAVAVVFWRESRRQESSRVFLGLVRVGASPYLLSPRSSYGNKFLAVFWSSDGRCELAVGNRRI
jgi:hypothetical protein